MTQEGLLRDVNGCLAGIRGFRAWWDAGPTMNGITKSGGKNDLLVAPMGAPQPSARTPQFLVAIAFAALLVSDSLARRVNRRMLG